MHRRRRSQRSPDQGRRGVEQAARRRRQHFPGLGNNYAALGAWESQLTDVPISPDRKANLREPVDAVRDHGAHGMFDDRAGGLLDPSFLRSLPGVVRMFVAAWRRTTETKVHRYGRSVALKTGNIR